MTDKETFLQKIRAAFPKLQWHDAQMITEGWDHVVIILDEKTVFRFPQDDEYKNMLQNEIAVLKVLKPLLPITIPDYEYIAPDFEFAGYPIVPGRVLNKKQFETLSADEQAAIAKQLAEFLTALHSLDNKQPDFAKVRTSYLDDDQLRVKKMMSNLDDVLSPSDRQLVDNIMNKVDELATQALPVVLTHGDVYSRHLLWDKDQHRLGVIDFSDMSHADPALDFAELHEYGQDFVDTVYQHYAGPKDDQFLERAWIYQCWVGVYLLVDFFRYHKTSWEVSRETFDFVKAANRAPAVQK